MSAEDAVTRKHISRHRSALPRESKLLMTFLRFYWFQLRHTRADTASRRDRRLTYDSGRDDEIYSSYCQRALPHIA